VGGHCLPVDPVYLSDEVERTLGKTVDFVDLAVRVNQSQPQYVVDRAVRLLNQQGRAASTANVLVLGVAYKANTADMRETPATAIIDQLRGLDAQVTVCDPQVGDLAVTSRWADVKVAELAAVAGAAAAADLTILVTDHDDFPYELIAREAGHILDTRNRFALGSNVHKL
jgi:UDP-N-acetyl-D-glucosamine dehydrogenase